MDQIKKFDFMARAQVCVLGCVWRRVFARDFALPIWSLPEILEKNQTPEKIRFLSFATLPRKYVNKRRKKSVET